VYSPEGHGGLDERRGVDACSDLGRADTSLVAVQASMAVARPANMPTLAYGEHRVSGV
jgi:hypothetical protein